MLVTPFGSCRVEDVAHSSYLNKLTSYTHCTKETIQLIKYVKGDLKFDTPHDMFCLRASIKNGKPLEYDPKFKELFDNTNAFVVEISSMKKYTYKDKYLTHMAVDKRLFDQDYKKTPQHIIDETEIVLQTDQEIENDILEIRRLLSPKPMIVVSHTNVTHRGDKLEKRDHLIKLLEQICKRHGIMFINPTVLMTQFEQRDIIEPDLGHHLPIAKHVVYNHINMCVSYLMKKGDFYKRYPDIPVFLHS
jgi:hypothetical protein